MKRDNKPLSREDGQYYCLSPLLPFPWHLERITSRYDPDWLAYCRMLNLDPRGKHYANKAEEIRIAGMTEGQLANDLCFDENGNQRVGEL